MLKESVNRLDSFSKTALEITQMQTVKREMDKKALDINSIISTVINEKHIGLGLSYVQTFPDIHNGSIDIKSSEEETVITLVFEAA